MQSRKPLFGTISLAMAALAVAAIFARVMHHVSDAWAPPTIIGLVCAVVGRRRNEHPKSLSTVGLFANVAILTVLFVLALLGGLALGGWLKPE
jgi:1,4-dihydroxy-2-naphthoate octaprenyltransferase